MRFQNPRARRYWVTSLHFRQSEPSASFFFTMVTCMGVPFIDPWRVRRTRARLRDVKVALRDVAEEHVVGRLARLGTEQTLEALADLAARHEDPIALQDLPDQLVVGFDRLCDGEVPVCPGAAACPEVQGCHLEEREIGLTRLEQDDVTLEMRVVLILPDAELEARVEQRAENLVQDREHSLVGERPTFELVGVALG